MTPEEAEMRERLGIEEGDIMYIPAGALWELCRQFKDALPGQLGEKYVGLQLFGHFKRLMETRRVTNYDDGR